MNESRITPLYQQVKEDIKTAIEQGRYKAKEKIPSEPELSAEYSVSRITLRRAVEELCNEGYLIKRQGQGTFVSTPRIHRKMAGGNRLESFTKTCQNYNMKAGARLLSRQIVPARQDEQEFFGLGEDGLLVYVERVRTADGLPIFLENQFFPYQEFRGLMEEDLNDVSLFEVIERVSGRRPVDSFRRTLEITRASVEQAQKLGIPLSEPLMHLNSYFVDEEGKPLCIGRQYYIGSRYMFDL
ncbi:GntR family transcriptional regulator [Clostridium sp. chh4-2]|uniref:GntR family transcriptional regulator n=1 Tax=Clostridium sp. chh4-2 TaxID=2067550 RepID=UPI000CCF353D|nr:GntR family transcriptional regulator [Clostridium sp. chh4-2]PNV61533.1 GntR family transcriptional regulator [Clostridium sp. chh4-2]